MKKSASGQEKPNRKVDAAVSAAQAWRDRLDTTKKSTRATGGSSSAATPKRTRVQNTTPGNTTRKSRKGLRPG